MYLSWLVPDTSYLSRLEGWEAVPYLPRHGRPPALLRLVRSATISGDDDGSAARLRRAVLNGGGPGPGAPHPAS